MTLRRFLCLYHLKSSLSLVSFKRILAQVFGNVFGIVFITSVETNIFGRPNVIVVCVSVNVIVVAVNVYSRSKSMTKLLGLCSPRVTCPSQGQTQNYK